PADISLIADHISPFYKRAVLDAAVDHAGSMISGQPKQTSKFKVFVFSFGIKVIVFRNGAFPISGHDNTILYSPELFKFGRKHLPSFQRLSVKKALSSFYLLTIGNSRHGNCQKEAKGNFI